METRIQKHGNTNTDEQKRENRHRYADRQTDRQTETRTDGHRPETALSSNGKVHGSYSIRDEESKILHLRDIRNREY